MFLLLFAPAITPLVPIIAIVVIIGKVIYFIPTFCRMVWRVFKLIHSDMRVLCMTDAALGALAGYYLGSALIGGFIGAGLGWVNYQLVSVRWLKLVSVQMQQEE